MQSAAVKIPYTNLNHHSNGSVEAASKASTDVTAMSLTPDSSLSMSCGNDSDCPANNSNSGNNNNAKTARSKRRKKKTRLCESLSTARFRDIYYLTNDILGEGSYGRVETCINMFTDVEYAVKLINKSDWCFSRSKVLKEVEIYYLCQGQPNIIQLVEYFEEEDYFYLVFEKANGGPLLDQIQKRVKFTEEEAAKIIKDLASALAFLHERGIAHRDLKPENVLCVNADSPWPIKLCDFDLCSGIHQSITTPQLQSPVGSAEYMAPEVVNAFSSSPYHRDDDDLELSYDKRCDLWSLGVLAYVLLCGYLPFSAGRCENSDCGWENGDAECSSCQSRLFKSICSGELVFPEQHSWGAVSEEAKDLIAKLLVKDANRRLDAAAVLEHEWIVEGGSKTNVVETPSVLRRQASTTSLKFAADIAGSNDLVFNSRIVDNSSSVNSRKKSVNDRLLFSSQSSFMSNGLPTVEKSSRKTSLAASMMRRQTSLVFDGQPDENDELLLLRHQHQYHPSHFSLHRCEL